MNKKELDKIKDRLKKHNAKLRAAGDRPMSLAEYMRTLPGGVVKIGLVETAGRKRTLGEQDRNQE